VARIALTKGLSRRQVADDPRVDFSTLNKWMSAYRDTDGVSVEDRELARESERLRHEGQFRGGIARGLSN
jgi:transposase